ncbi:MAG: hypothetical protein DIKNOCCD_01364 [bacterium]|nr:hypothetical protein [bacterium]
MHQQVPQHMPQSDIDFEECNHFPGFIPDRSITAEPPAPFIPGRPEIGGRFARTGGDLGVAAKVMLSPAQFRLVR